MAEIVNLRQARKDKARAEKQAAAKTNRAAHGRTKADKKLKDARAEKTARDLDAHKRDR
jgi:Domain of unknown function (DUF4169)